MTAEAAACAVCAGAVAPPAPCPRCGAPDLPEEASRALAAAAGHLAAGRLDAAIRSCQQAVKAAPAVALPHLKLAEACERRAAGGQPDLLRLADRAINAALVAAPTDRAAHLARVVFGARTGRALLMRVQYERQRETLACAAECLRVLDALEAAGAAKAAVSAATGEMGLRARYFLMLGGALSVGGLVEFAAIVHAALTDEEYVIMGHMDFVWCVLLLTGAGGFFLEGLRQRREHAARYVPPVPVDWDA